MNIVVKLRMMAETIKRKAGVRVAPEISITELMDVYYMLHEAADTIEARAVPQGTTTLSSAGSSQGRVIPGTNIPDAGTPPY